MATPGKLTYAVHKYSFLMLTDKHSINLEVYSNVNPLLVNKLTPLLGYYP
ncbi:hypothetical protein imdm_1267 [gamma proteobacterium IMCC2047]|nr:hypothetical protein imdm_1267 [gamma proteobacterium IMCC2047]